MKKLIYVVFAVVFCLNANASGFRGLESVIPDPKNPSKNMVFKSATDNVNWLKGYISNPLSANPKVKADQIYQNIDQIADEIGALLVHSTTNAAATGRRLKNLDPQSLKRGDNAYGIRAATADDAQTLRNMAWLAGFYGAYLPAKHMQTDFKKYSSLFGSTFDYDLLLEYLNLNKLCYGLSDSKILYRSHVAYIVRFIEIGAGPAAYIKHKNRYKGNNLIDQDYLDSFKVDVMAGRRAFKNVMGKALQENVQKINNSLSKGLMESVKRAHKGIDTKFDEISKQLRQKIEIEPLPENATDEQRWAMQESWKKKITDMELSLADVSGSIDAFAEDIKNLQLTDLEKHTMRVAGTHLVSPEDIALQAKEVKKIYQFIMEPELENYAAKLIYEPLKNTITNIRDVSILFPDITDEYRSLVSFLKQNKLLLNMDQVKTINRVKQSVKSKMEKTLHISGVWGGYKPDMERSENVDDEIKRRLLETRERGIYGILPDFDCDLDHFDEIGIYDFYILSNWAFREMSGAKKLKLYRTVMRPEVIKNLEFITDLEEIELVDCPGVDYVSLLKMLTDYTDYKDSRKLKFPKLKKIRFFDDAAVDVGSELTKIMKDLPKTRPIINLSYSSAEEYYSIDGKIVTKTGEVLGGGNKKPKVRKKKVKKKKKRARD